MSSEIDTAGDLATASLAAAAIEGAEAGPGDSDDRGDRGDSGAGKSCANCGRALDGPFCSQCGQRAAIHRTLFGLVEELVHNLWHLDAKIWRTLPLLAFRPGALTHEYIHGRRARYVSPLALFLFVIFIGFFVFSLEGGFGEGAADSQLEELAAQLEDGSGALPEGLEPEEAARMASELERLGMASPEAVARLRAAIAERQAADMQPGADGAAGPAADTSATSAEDSARSEEISALVQDIVAASQSETAEDGRAEGEGDRSATVNTGSAALDAAILRNLENPELAFYKIQNALPRYSFLLVPLSLPFIWLLFAWKRGVNLFDHCVFILYSLSFMSMLFTAVTLIARVPVLGGSAASAALFVPPVHIFFQIKGAYRLSGFSAAWRTVAVLFIALIALMVFTITIFLFGFLT